MEVVYRRCGGIDVHKESISVCVLLVEEGGAKKEVRRFGTMTRDLQTLSLWLEQLGVTHVAMESTGVYWKPVWNLLEGQFELLLVNAQHIKQAPGRKTDIRDCEWIADLLQHGLLRGSYVPKQEQRDLRDLTRYRVRLTEDKARLANRIQKVLEDANIKLASVATDVLGASGRSMLQAIAAGVDEPEKLAQMARKGLRKKLPQLRWALQGHIRERHRFLLRQLLDELRFTEDKISELEQRIQQCMRPYHRAITLWTSMPGIRLTTAWSMAAEIGTNPEQFPQGSNLASWAGMCPGNNESAGKRKSGRTRKGNRWLRRTLNQAAWAAARTKNTYFAARFHRLAAKPGSKRAIVAIGHKTLVLAHYWLQHDCPFRELGADYHRQLRAPTLSLTLVRRLQRLGFQVTLTPAPQVL
ncbi:MAG: IS110 family transposase [Candidatus Acidiferrales bacterium]